jgi:DNA-directed RNA polymerase
MKAIYSGKKWIIQDKQWLAFRNIIKRLKNRNITVLLLQAPVTRDAYQLYTNNYEIDSMFQTLAPYFNLNESMKMDDKFDFMDYHHLNQSGVRKVNNSVLEILSLETSLN